eukprot:CAMPEP_0172177696 /NCGR_PEP_ID=MMETSP1050-20130122/15598_1 /TAXON_ID=233186 /ORGANISM="Cryptomonas curvata, Strain CCAP979/52" /LENGTH=101 /DNA_ID=CAMNT_0012850281 /DNA_START=866 /DNA_END=1167 /DNA_ORIENTATION=+
MTPAESESLAARARPSPSHWHAERPRLHRERRRRIPGRGRPWRAGAAAAEPHARPLRSAGPRRAAAQSPPRVLLPVYGVPVYSSPYVQSPPRTRGQGGLLG